MTESNKVLILLISAILIWVFYLLTPVLMPFFVSALLAYLGDPLVDRLEKFKLSRTLSVTIVFSALFIVLLILLLVLVPMLTAQISALLKRLPDYIDVIQASIIPFLSNIGVPVEFFDLETIRKSLVNYWSEVGKMAGGVVGYMTQSGLAVLQLVTNLVLIPVVTFYLLRDWDDLVAAFRHKLPRRYSEVVIKLSKECDLMIAAFMRGQLMVMSGLATMYTIGLTLIGLDLALLLGVIAGIVSFVPYLGLIVGIGLAGTAAFLQFHEWLPVFWVVVVFSVAQTVEGMVLTPRFVGEQIGLHPVAVIFAIMAGGQLFGFTGILLALPVTAVIMVLLRYAMQRYVNSPLYFEK
jgi:predicted PurR-regulated permease PerM